MVKNFYLFLGTAVLAGFTVAPLHADPVSICVGYNGGTCSVVASGNGSAAYTSTSNPDYSILVAAGSGTPSNQEPTLALSTLQTTSLSSSATQLTVELTETGLTVPSPLPFENSFAATQLTAAGISFANYISNSNLAFDTTGTLIGSFNASTAGASAMNTTSALNYTTPFSETEVITVNFTGNGQTAQGQDMITSSPEPMSLGLLGGGLAALGVLRFRKARKQA